MKRILLTTVAVFPLLAVGMWPASSQEGRQQPGASQSQGTSGAQEKRGQAPGREQGAAKSSPAQERTQGRAQEGQSGNKSVGQAGSNERGQQAGQNERTQERGKAGTQPQPRGAQNQPKSEPKGAKNPAQTTTGQSNRNQESPSGQNRGNAAGQQKQQPQPGTTGQNQRPQQNTTGQNPQRNTTGQNQQPQRNTTGQNQQPQPSTGPNERTETNGARGSVTLTEDQRAKIQQNVLSGRNVPREERVDFSVNVGTVVPSRVRVVAVPSLLIDIHPEWRGDEFFVVRDDIIIVDRSRRIVAMVPVGSGRSSLGTRGSSTASFESPAEIREIQQVLIEKGFFHGRVDGKMGPETTQALIAFQRSEGLEASGRIDERTTVALGVSGRTQGQGPGAGQPGNANAPGQNNQNTGANPPGRNNPGTTGQGGNQPSANPSGGRGPNNQGSQGAPSTSGQGPNERSSNPEPSTNQQPKQNQQRQ